MDELALFSICINLVKSLNQFYIKKRYFKAGIYENT